MSPQQEGRRPTSPPEESNRKCCQQRSLPSSSPARAGDAVYFPGCRGLLLIPFPLSLACPRSWKAGGKEKGKQAEVLGWRRCGKVETIFWNQMKLDAKPKYHISAQVSHAGASISS